MPPFFSRITGKDRSSTAGHKGTTVPTTETPNIEVSSTNSVPSSFDAHLAPRVMINDGEEEEEELTPSNVPRTTTNPFGVTGTDSRRNPPPPISATPPTIETQVESDFPDIMTPKATHPGNGPPPGLGAVASGEAKPIQHFNRTPSRSSSLVSLSLRNKVSQASLRNQTRPPPNGQRSRRGSTASSDGGSVNRNNTADTITSPQTSPSIALGRTSSIATSSLLAAPTFDSDNVSIRSGVSTSGKKKRIWPTKKQNTSGIAGALAQSGMSLASPGAGLTASPPLVPQSSPPRRSNNVRGGHVSRTSIDNVLQPRRGSLNSPAGRTSDEHEGYPGDTDEIYESPDALSFDEDDMPVTGFAVASSKRNADFHDLFPNIEEGDYLIEGI